MSYIKNKSIKYALKFNKKSARLLNTRPSYKTKQYFSTSVRKYNKYNELDVHKINRMCND